MSLLLVRVGDISEQVRGVTYAKGDASANPSPGRMPLLRAGNITDSGLSFEDLVFIPQSRISPKQVVRQGDVVIAASSGSLDIVGKAAQATADFPGAFGAFCKVLRPSAQVDQRYFGHYFRTRAYRLRISRLAAGANINNLRKEHLDDLIIPLPPMPQQQRIGRLLDHVDALRAQRRETITLLDDLTQSIFLEMFGVPDPTWPQATVSDVAVGRKDAIRTGPFGSQLLHDEFVNSGVAVLGIDNAVGNEFKWQGLRFITEEKYEKLARYRVWPGDVLITIMGTCGRCAVVPDDIPPAINTKHLCCITLDQDRCLPEFLHSYFLVHPDAREYLRKNAKGAIMAGLNMGIIKELPVALPPLELQEKFVVKIKSIRALRVRQEAHLAELDALFASLQHRAFRGELWPEAESAA